MDNSSWEEMLRAPALFLSASALLLGVARAADRPLLQKQEKELRSIEAVNVDVSYGVVSGTVTMRASGVLVDPQQVTYAFQPEFPNSRGRLQKKGNGIYVLKLGHIPSARNYTLVISAAYNDTLIRDGLVKRQGQTRTGRLELPIPFGRTEYSFGEQLLDLR